MVCIIVLLVFNVVMYKPGLQAWLALLCPPFFCVHLPL